MRRICLKAIIIVSCFVSIVTAEALGRRTVLLGRQLHQLQGEHENALSVCFICRGRCLAMRGINKSSCSVRNNSQSRRSRRYNLRPPSHMYAPRLQPTSEKHRFLSCTAVYTGMSMLESHGDTTSSSPPHRGMRMWHVFVRGFHGLLGLFLP